MPGSPSRLFAAGRAGRDRARPARRCARGGPGRAAQPGGDAADRHGRHVKMSVAYDGPLKAPIKKGDHVADLVVRTAGRSAADHAAGRRERRRQGRLLRPHRNGLHHLFGGMTQAAPRGASSASKAGKASANRPSPARSPRRCARVGSRWSRRASPAAAPAPRRSARCCSKAAPIAGARAPRPCCSRPRAPTMSTRRSCRRSKRGTWVICDRFLDSSIAYQGGADGLGDRPDPRAARGRQRRACCPTAPCC